MANNIRKEILQIDPILDSISKHSNYNKNLIIDKCSITDCSKKAIDTHHIKFQCTADSKGFINSMQKDHLSNLVPLCKECHQDVHKGKIMIEGYKVSTTGTYLSYSYS